MKIRLVAWRQKDRFGRLALTALLMTSATAQGAQWTGNFTISGSYISGAENQHVRIYGMPPLPALCPNGPTYAYLNQSHAGSKTYIAALMMAQATGKPVNLYVQSDGSGYCQIVELMSSTN